MREAWGVFLILLLGAAWFHQGGGWNQNVRFSQVRAVVEESQLSVDDHLFYQLTRDEAGHVDYRRLRLSDPGTRALRFPEANGFDLSVHAGRFYPAKPPGLSFFAAPAYLVIQRAGAALGLGPDGWLALTLNLHLTTLFSVGLCSALGGVVFLLLTRRLFPDAPDAACVAAALGLGLGTLWLPYSTMLFDHVPVAALSLLALTWIHAAAGDVPAPPQRRRLLLAGLACGALVALNYGAVLTVACLCAYALARCRPVSRLGWLALGGLPFALGLAAYHRACFGSPFSIAYGHELAVFQTASAPFLGVFDTPDPRVLVRLLVGPYRGLFVSSPVLAVAVWGIAVMIRDPRTRSEGLLAVAVSTLYLLQVSAFNGWHGGSTIGPRYLMPMIPFVALGLVPAFTRVPRLTGALAIASALLMFVVTAVDPQVDVEIASPLVDYYLPLATHGVFRWDDWEVLGPVSARTFGAAGGGLEVSDSTSSIARWNSYNLGELLFERSWLSVTPLLAAWAAIASICLRRRQAS